MLAILHLLATFVANLFRSRRRLEIENLFLRHQLNIALRRVPRRLRLHGSDRALLVWITWVWPNLLDLSRVVKPETILRWHRSGFKAFWRWKSRHRSGRPKIDRELRDLIRQRIEMSVKGQNRTLRDAWNPELAAVSAASSLLSNLAVAAYLKPYSRFPRDWRHGDLGACRIKQLRGRQASGRP
jgi:hypothetical protein